MFASARTGALLEEPMRLVSHQVRPHRSPRFLRRDWTPWFAPSAPKTTPPRHIAGLLDNQRPSRCTRGDQDALGVHPSRCTGSPGPLTDAVVPATSTPSRRSRWSRGSHVLIGVRHRPGPTAASFDDESRIRRPLLDLVGVRVRAMSSMQVECSARDVPISARVRPTLRVPSRVVRIESCQPAFGSVAPNAWSAARPEATSQGSALSAPATRAA